MIYQKRFHVTKQKLNTIYYLSVIANHLSIISNYQFIQLCKFQFNYIISGHDNVNFGSGNNEYHCHLPNDQHGHNNFPRNGYFRKSIAGEANYAKVEKPHYNNRGYNTIRVSNGSSPSQPFVYPTSSQLQNGHIPWPAYATVQNRQRHHRASILPPGVTSDGSIQDNDGLGGTIRRFASIQLRSKSVASSKGRKHFSLPLIYCALNILIHFSIA